MDQAGIHTGFLIVQLLNLTLLCGGWLLPAGLAIWSMRRRALPETARAVWVLIVLIVPVFGALAFWVLRPGQPGAADKD